MVHTLLSALVNTIAVWSPADRVVVNVGGVVVVTE